MSKAVLPPHIATRQPANIKTDEPGSGTSATRNPAVLNWAVGGVHPRKCIADSSLENDPPVRRGDLPSANSVSLHSSTFPPWSKVPQGPGDPANVPTSVL